MENLEHANFEYRNEQRSWLQGVWTPESKSRLSLRRPSTCSWAECRPPCDCFVQAILTSTNYISSRRNACPSAPKPQLCKNVVRERHEIDDGLDRISHCLAARSRLEHPKILGAFTPGLAPRSHFLSLFPNLASS